MLCAMEPHLQLRRFHLERDLNSEPLDQKDSAKSTELPDPQPNCEKNDMSKLLTLKSLPIYHEVNWYTYI